MRNQRGTDEVLIFARYPELGKCKTRLAKSLGEEAALKVYRSLLDHTLRAVRAFPGKGILFVEPAEKAEGAASWAPGMHDYLPQSDGDLGARLQAAVQSRFAQHARRILLLGCDCPQISTNSLASAFQALESCDVVLGPAEDGGYYLLGVKRSLPFLFQGIPWSTDKVTEETLNILKKHSLSYILQNTLSDVDTLEDLNRVRHLEPLKSLGIG